MQIASSASSPFAHGLLQKPGSPGARPSATAGPQAAFAIAPGTQPAPSTQSSQAPVDVAAVLAHWGTSHAAADLNADGIVDAQDLAIASAASPSGAGAVTSQWGQPGAQDLNGDGTTDAQDLAIALAQSGAAGAASPPAGAIETIVDTAFEARDLDRDGMLRASDLGGDATVRRLDLDRDGGVGREELAGALAREFRTFRQSLPTMPADAFVQRWREVFEAGRPAPDYAAAGRIKELFARAEPGAARQTSRTLSARA